MSRDAGATGGEPARAEELARFTARMTAWIEKLESEPGISAVTYAHRFPGQEGSLTFEAESEAAQPIRINARTNRVATNFFDVLGVSVLAGRGFSNADVSPGAQGIIVDQVFAAGLAAGGNVLGRRVRVSGWSPDGAADHGPWHEIVGVVPSFADAIAPSAGLGDPGPRLYLAAGPGDNQPVTVIIQVNGGDPTRFSQRLRELTASVHPTLKLDDLTGVVQDFDHGRQAFWYLSLGIIAVTASVLLSATPGGASPGADAIAEDPLEVNRACAG